MWYNGVVKRWVAYFLNRWFDVGPTSPVYANVMPTILLQVSRWANVGPTLSIINNTLEKLDFPYFVFVPTTICPYAALDEFVISVRS